MTDLPGSDLRWSDDCAGDQAPGDRATGGARRTPSPWRVARARRRGGRRGAARRRVLGRGAAGAAPRPGRRRPLGAARDDDPDRAGRLRDARRARARRVRAAAPRGHGVDADRPRRHRHRGRHRVPAQHRAGRVRRGHLDAPVDRAPGPDVRERRRPAPGLRVVRGGARRLRDADRPRPDAAADHDRRGRRHGPRARRRDAHRRRLDHGPRARRALAAGPARARRRCVGARHRDVVDGGAPRRRRRLDRGPRRPGAPRPADRHGPVRVRRALLGDRRLVLRRDRRVRAGQRPAADQRLGRPDDALRRAAAGEDRAVRRPRAARPGPPARGAAAAGDADRRTGCSGGSCSSS